jgi:HEAT repeat protein
MIPIPPTSDLPAAVLVTVGFRASVIVAAAFLLAGGLRRRAAASRHAVWAVAFASLLLLPVVSTVAPRWDLGTAAPAGTGAAPVPAERPAASAITLPPRAASVAPAHEHPEPMTPSPSPVARPAVLVLALVGLWLAGVVAGLVRLVASGAAASRLTRRARTPVDPVLARRAAAAARTLGIRRPVRIVVSEEMAVPMTWGLARPVVVLPTTAARWTAARQRVVMLHELAHVRRMDFAANLAAEMVRAVYWMNPLVWMAARAAHRELERACDDTVLCSGTRSVEYAKHLYAIAAAVAGRAPAGALAMAQPSTLVDRIRAILSAGMDRSPLRGRVLAGAAAVALIVGVPLASLRLLGEGREAAVERAAVRALGSPDAAARARAAWELGRARSVLGATSLAEHLRDPDAGVRGMAAWAVGATGPRDAVALLTAVLGDPDSDVREMAVLALGNVGDRRAVPALASLAHDPAMGVRAVLTDALAQLGGPQAGTALTELLLHDADAHTRSMAAWDLRATLGRDATPELLAGLHDPDVDVRRSAVGALYALADGRALVPLSAVAVKDPAPEVRAAACHALGALQDSRAAEALSRALSDSSYDVRVYAAAALGRTPGQQATDALIAATRDPAHVVRLTAVRALSHQAT